MADSSADARLEQALVNRALLGERHAFEQLVRRHQGMVRAQLRRLLHGDDAAADDLAQETFLLAWRKLAQFRGEARFGTWLYRIAYSCFLQAYRRKPNDLHDEEAIDQMHAPPIDLDLRMDLDRAMRHLSVAEQSVLLHCVQLGLSHDEAAYVLGMPLGTVKSHASRGKSKLQQLLSGWREPASQGAHHAS